MVPTEVFDSYWRFAAERQAILFRRLAGGGAPWTSDPILQTHRFTNAFRFTDRVSQFLIREVQQGVDRSQDARELFFRTILFKFFNRIETWQALEARFGPMAWSTFNFEMIASVLDDRQDRGLRNYSAAYIMPPPSLGYRRKHANHLAVLVHMMKDGLPEKIQKASTLAEVYELLQAYPGLGPFLAFQYAIDLNYSDLIDFDENDFVVAGPGALDGIAKCFVGTLGRSPSAVIEWMVQRQDDEFERLGLSFQRVHGRRLHLIDCQNLFCEISKYARVAHPTVAGRSGRTRIKQTYRPDPGPLAPITSPRGWRLQVERSAVGGVHAASILA